MINTRYIFIEYQIVPMSDNLQLAAKWLSHGPRLSGHKNKGSKSNSRCPPCIILLRRSSQRIFRGFASRCSICRKCNTLEAAVFLMENAYAIV